MAVVSQGVDFDFPPRPTAADLVAAGKRFAGRYVGPGTADKHLTAPECDDLLSHGIDIFLLAEGVADGATGGRLTGRSHALQASSDAAKLGAPADIPIYFAVDYDVTAQTWPAARDYLAGAGEILGPARVGVYGERDVMAWAQRDGVASWFFQTYAWSRGLWFAGNHIEQYLNGQIIGAGHVDLCRAMRENFGQWRSAVAPPKGDEMGLLVYSGKTAAVYYGTGATAPSGRVALWHVKGEPPFGPGLLDALKKSGAAEIHLPSDVAPEDTGIYDIDPQPWPVGGHQPPTFPQSLTFSTTGTASFAPATPGLTSSNDA